MTEKPARILIIDDNLDFLHTMETFLVRNGFETTIVDDGQKGLELIRGGRFDLILLDVMMETFFSGFEVCKRLKENPSSKDIPVIGVSGMGDDLRYFYDKGREEHFCPDVFLEKPVNKKELLSKIKQLITRR